MGKKDIELICALVPEWRSGQIKIKKAGGQTNRNWIVEYNGKKYFVRIPWERNDIVDRKIEGKNILALSRNKKLKAILPKYLVFIYNDRNILQPKAKKVFQAPDGTMMMEYIEGRDINGKDLESSKTQYGLLKSLHIFHNSGVRFANIYDVFRDELSKYRKKAKQYPINKLIDSKRIKAIEDIEKKAREKLVIAGKISTHNDLIFENLRLGKDGKVYFLDFEYGGFNIRDGLHYDLGIILGGNLFQKNPIALKTFGEFLKKAKKIYKKDLDDYKIYCGALTNILVMFWWGLVRYFSVKNKKEKKYFKDYVLRRSNGIDYIFSFLQKKGLDFF